MASATSGTIAEYMVPGVRTFLTSAATAGPDKSPVAYSLRDARSLTVRMPIRLGHKANPGSGGGTKGPTDRLVLFLVLGASTGAFKVAATSWTSAQQTLDRRVVVLAGLAVGLAARGSNKCLSC